MTRRWHDWYIRATVARAIALPLSLSLLLAAACAHAARPLATEDAGIVPQNGVEIELGHDMTRESSLGTCHYAGAVVKTGISERMDLGMAIPVDISSSPAWGNINVCAKLLLAKNAAAGLPLVSRFGFCPGTGDYGTTLVSGFVAGPWTFHGNAGVTVAAADETGEALASGAVEFGLGTLSLVAEILHAGGTTEILGGVRWNAFKDIDLDAGLGTGLSDNSASLRTAAGLTVRM